MHILILSFFYSPEPVAKPHDLAVELRKLGHEVTVITGYPNYPGGKIYPGYHMRLWQHEMIDGISVWRVAHLVDRSHSAVRRMLSYLSFSFLATLVCLIKVGRPDVIWTYQIGLPGILISWLKRSPLVHEVQDLWPEWGQTAGMGLKSWLFSLLDAQERFIYRCARAVTTISGGFRAALLKKGVPEAKITVLPNWANEINFQPASVDEALARREGLWGCFNIIYGGNIGSAQALDVVIGAAERLSDCPAVQFTLIGDGIERARLEKRVQSKSLTNVRFLGSRPPEQMSAYYALADVLLLPLKDNPNIAITIPSKTYAYLASGKPILAAANGDVADLIVECSAGLVCPPEDPTALEQTVRRFLAMPLSERQRMSAAGREVFLSRFTRQVLVQRYQSLFERVVVKH